MGKLTHAQVPLAVGGPIKTKGTAEYLTGEGAPAYHRKAKGELFLLAVTNMVSESTFYEAAGDRDARFRDLIAKITAKDPDWIAGFIPYLRNEMNMRTAAIVMAVEYALSSKRGAASTPVRDVVASALQRADEPAEFIAYWITRTKGKTLPGGVQRGVADAVQRLYTERAVLKYDGTNQPWRMGDVIELVHPRPMGAWQSDLFRYLLDRRHHADDVRVGLDSLPTLAARKALDEVPAEDRRAVPGFELHHAGMTWETYASYLNGPMDAAAWETIIPSMGYMALLRNLRNFEQAGVSRETVREVCDRLSDPAQVARSRQFPMRFLSAFKAAQSVHWSSALEDALNLSLGNLPELSGDSLILVDMSGSMFVPMSARSELTRAEAAAVFGAALTVRNPNSRLVCFGTDGYEYAVAPGASVLPLVQKMTHSLGGTNTAAAVQAALLPHHKRVILLTDEQEGGYSREPASRYVPDDVWLHTFNLAGYRDTPTQSVGRRSTMGGLSDAGFRIIPLVEAGESQTWPW